MPLIEVLHLLFFFLGLYFSMPEQNIKLNNCSAEAGVTCGQPGKVLVKAFR